MKKLFVLILLLNFQMGLATDPVKIELPERAKIEGTYSVTIEKNKSLHLIIAKDRNNKQYIIKPLIRLPDGSLKYFDLVELELLPEILSHHMNGQKIILTGHNYKKKELYIIEINAVDGTNTVRAIQDQKQPNFVLRTDDETFLVRRKGNARSLFVQRIRTSEDEELIQIDVPKEKISQFKRVVESLGSEINQNEYVHKGSISESKVYLQDEKLIFTKDNIQSYSAWAMTAELDVETPLTFLGIKGSSLEKPKDYNTYYLDGRMFSVIADKTDLLFSTYDLELKTELNAISLKNDLADKYDQTPEFLKRLAKGKMRPTVAINKTKDGNYLVEINQVDKTVYYYNYDWWWHHNWMFNDFFWQQHNQHVQDVINNLPSVPRFTPSPDMYEGLDALYAKAIDFESIKFVVDRDGNLLTNSSQETVFQYIDKDEFLDPFKEDNKKLNFTASFTDTTMSYIYQDKKSKDVFVSFQSILE